MNRREYLASMMGVGVTAAGAAALGGFALPGRALAEEPQKGGTLRISMLVKEIKDPRLLDWSEMPTSRASRSNTWSAGRASSSSSPGCWRAGRSTTTRPSTRSSCARASSGPTATISRPRTSMPTSSAGPTRRFEGNSVASRVEHADRRDDRASCATARSLSRRRPHGRACKPAMPDIALIAAMTGLSRGGRPPQLRSEQGRPDRAVQQRHRSVQHHRDGSPASRAAVERPRHARGGAARSISTRSSWIDHGTDPTAMIAAMEAGEVDTNLRDATPTRSSRSTRSASTRARSRRGNTIVVRMNVKNKPYDDERVRRAVAERGRQPDRAGARL